MKRHVLPEDRFYNGLTYEQFWKKFIKNVESTCPGTLDSAAKTAYEYALLNRQRSTRVNKTYRISPSLQVVLEQLPFHQRWMVITEDWCGDSAQVLPLIARIAAASEHITLRIVLRDKNLDIMDQYLTEGKRSIPKLIAFDDDGMELFQWGPRPAAAADIVRIGFAKNMTKETVYPRLHAWYARDRGRSIEAELQAQLEATINSTCALNQD